MNVGVQAQGQDTPQLDDDEHGHGGDDGRVTAATVCSPLLKARPHGASRVSGLSARATWSG